jgi:hypothetical protein
VPEWNFRRRECFPSLPPSRPLRLPYGMDESCAPTPPGPIGASAAAGAIATPPPTKTFRDAVLREEIETWINEGGAGDEPGP